MLGRKASTNSSYARQDALQTSLAIGGTMRLSFRLFYVLHLATLRGRGSSQRNQVSVRPFRRALPSRTSRDSDGGERIYERIVVAQLHGTGVDAEYSQFPLERLHWVLLIDVVMWFLSCRTITSHGIILRLAVAQPNHHKACSSLRLVRSL